MVSLIPELNVCSAEKEEEIINREEAQLHQSENQGRRGEDSHQVSETMPSAFEGGGESGLARVARYR